MAKSKIEFRNGRPYININGTLHAPLAYTTYFEECAEYADFIESGYGIFFVNVSFTDLPINNVTGFSPFTNGVFENETPDYAEFDRAVKRILSMCPDARIFPRINVAMPRKWLESNPSETVETPSGKRESLCSEAFLRDGSELLRRFVSHMRSADYAEKIAGYQLCGGTTQEWIHYDLCGSFSATSLQKFRSWAKEKYGIADMPSLSKKDFESGVMNETTALYGEFCCGAAAKAAEHFAKKLKEFTNGEQIAGVFYGYSAFVNDCLWGLNGLRFVIDSPYIDFFSSPCAYDAGRRLGFDWGDMLPCESVKCHGKLCFIECDIRTHLTRRMQASRPGRYPDGIYSLTDESGNKTVWSGPESPSLSLSAVRKAFAHQLTKGSGIWWFDMWGGWYHSETIMAEMKKMKAAADKATEKDSSRYPSAQAVIFIDEKAYLNLPRGNHLCNTVNHIRVAMGNSGIPFDLCMVEDAEKVLHKYQAAIFTAPYPSESGKNAVGLCRKNNVPCYEASAENPFPTLEELRGFLVSAGVHCYNPDGNVIYCGEGFIGVHAVTDGEITVSLPAEYTVTPLLGTDLAEHKTDKLTLIMNKHETAVFELI